MDFTGQPTKPASSHKLKVKWEIKMFIKIEDFEEEKIWSGTILRIFLKNQTEFYYSDRVFDPTLNTFKRGWNKKGMNLNFNQWPKRL